MCHQINLSLRDQNKIVMRIPFLEQIFLFHKSENSFKVVHITKCYFHLNTVEFYSFKKQGLRIKNENLVSLTRRQAKCLQPGVLLFATPIQ